MQSPLFESRLLDVFDTHGVGRDWYMKTQPYAQQLCHSYLVYRVHNEKDSSVGRFVEIRQIAQFVCNATGGDLSSTIEELGWLALERKGNAPSQGNRFPEHKDSNPRLNFLCAAVHFNLIPLVNQLLDEGLCPTRHDYLIPSPMEIASQTGNTDIMEIFQQRLPEFEELVPGGWQWLSKGNADWQGKIGPCSIIGAAIRGDLTILKLALYTPSRQAPDSTEIIRQSPGNIDPCTPIGKVLVTAARRYTKSPDISEYIYKLLKNRPSNDDLIEMLIWHAGCGNLPMVRYLLGKGVPVNGELPGTNALIEACRGFHSEVVGLLLEQDADPNARVEDSSWITALPMAASTGSLAIVCKLLDYGAQINEVPDVWWGSTRVTAIWWAVAVEHTAMFELLLERGASLEGRIGSIALELAYELGMMPMAERLQDLGAKIVEPIADSTPPWKLWAYYPGIYSV